MESERMNRRKYTFLKSFAFERALNGISFPFRYWWKTHFLFRNYRRQSAVKSLKTLFQRPINHIHLRALLENSASFDRCQWDIHLSTILISTMHTNAPTFGMMYFLYLFRDYYYTCQPFRLYVCSSFQRLCQIVKLKYVDSLEYFT